MPTVRYRIVTSTEFYRLRASVEEVRPVAEGILDELIDALTTPLTPEESVTPEKKESEESKPIKVTGESWETVAEKFNQLYLDNLWGDGLPMVPPTEERVGWMLSGTSRSPREILGKVSPKLGVATIEKIAINAVMAGAKPEYLPVIIAIMETITDVTFDDRHVLLSAGSFNLLIVVSGPIVNEIEIQAGIGFMGQGWRANNTIGRAVRLATLNIGHIWPAMNDMSLTGRISPHTFFTIAENSDMSRWEPYHVNRGFNTEDSCVTVASIHSASPMQHFYGGLIGTWNAEEILDRIGNDLKNRDRQLLMEWRNKGVGSIPGSGQGSQNHLTVLFPELVSEFNKMGYDQQKLQEEIFNRASLYYEELREEEVTSITMAMELGIVPPERKELFEAALKPGGKVPVMMSPENVHLFVSGGAPGCAFSFNYYRLPPYNQTALMTRKITGATLTKAGSQ
ncbi:MAG: hypothetical protein JSU58_00965 [Dehalococcoidales bacterium]|nr:MAG: hypothetical protein JSU58_00965 [Dehalococcoidales bacterium]